MSWRKPSSSLIRTILAIGKEMRRDAPELHGRVLTRNILRFRNRELRGVASLTRLLLKPLQPWREALHKSRGGCCGR
jgi:hypothetical protein